MESTKPKLLIILRNGVVDWVYSNMDTQYAIVDYDKKGTDQHPVIGVFDADVVECDLKELYNPQPSFCQRVEGDTSEYSRVYEKLFELQF